MLNRKEILIKYDKDQEKRLPNILPQLKLSYYRLVIPHVCVGNVTQILMRELFRSKQELHPNYISRKDKDMLTIMPDFDDALHQDLMADIHLLKINNVWSSEIEKSMLDNYTYKKKFQSKADQLPKAEKLKIDEKQREEGSKAIKEAEETILGRSL